MNKFNKLFSGLSLLFKKPSLINLIIDSEYRWNEYLQKNYPDTLQLPAIDFNDIAQKITELKSFTFLGGGSLPTDILLLTNLAQQIKDCAYFEIGTWRGESVFNVSEFAKECVTLNLSKEEIVSLDLSEKYADLHGVLSKGIDNISHVYGNSLHFDYKSLEKKFDLIFIDGNHEYEYVKNDTSKVFADLVHENTIVVWHDYAMSPEKVRSEVLAGILDGIPKNFQKKLYHVSNTLCAIYYPKEIKSKQLEFPINPEKTFEVEIKAKKI